MLQKLAVCLADATRDLRDSFSPRVLERLDRLRQEYAESLGGVYCEKHWLEVCAQTLTWTELAASLAERNLLDRRGFRWIISQEVPLWKEISQIDDRAKAALGSGPQVPLGPQPWDPWLDEAMRSRTARIDLSLLYELFLTAWSGERRARQGVYFTPPVIAQRVVELVDTALRRDLDMPLGLAENASGRGTTSSRGPRDALKIRILDPAAGSGVFLVAAIDRIHRTLLDVWAKARSPETTVRRRWNRYVAARLLPRLFGLELSPAACLAAHLEIAQKLAETGYAFSDPARVQVFTANTLAREDDGLTSHLPMTVILGNPPFAALSQNRGPWIEGLLKGATAAGRPTASYFQVDGQPLAERKHWLHDDYVKFLRYAQWRIEQAGGGVVGLVTNHGYLDNPTFRGVRRQLMQAFPRIEIIDLHGNRKKREQSPDGLPDENVFTIEQGVALGIFAQPPISNTGKASEGRKSSDDAATDSHSAKRRTSPADDQDANRHSMVLHADLWGTRAEKQRRLSGANGAGLAFVPLTPTPPFYFFVPRDESHREEYEHGWQLSEVMPVSVAAPVTARDGLVVAFTREELLERMAEFRDLSIPDAVLRERYFGRPRTVRYPPGDTRGWKLADARRQLAAQRHWQDAARSCLYRPFDRRWIYWSEAMIDWPRRAVMRHLEAPCNLALIARRQMPPTEPCRYFWATNQIALDGVIRSDNRGGESLFPLFLDGLPAESQRTRVAREANFSPEFLASLASIGACAGERLAELAFRYIYALFHAPSYRARFAEHLRVDFPRVFLPRHSDLLLAMSELGSQLLDAHLLRGPCTTQTGMPHGGSERGGAGGLRASHPAHGEEVWTPRTSAPLSAEFVGSDRLVASGYPRHIQDRVAINRDAHFAGISPEVWAWRVGGHQVARKWLKDRRGRVLTDTELATYGRMVTAATETMCLTSAIDRAIEQYGGWPEVFVGMPAKRLAKPMLS